MAVAVLPQAASMFRRTAEYGAAYIRRCYHGQTMWEITRWIETDVIARDCEPTYDKYIFFESLKIVIDDFLTRLRGDHVVSLVTALNREDFAARPFVCPNKLSIYRTHLCVAFTDCLVLVEDRYNREAPGREALKNMLLDMIGRLEFVEPGAWNERLERNVRDALRFLGHENPHEHFAAFGAGVLPQHE